MVQIIYGAGLRGIECARLRVKDIDFDRNEITVRRGKGQKDRVTMLPTELRDPIIGQLRYAKIMHDKDLSKGYGSVYMPFALAKKYKNAEREWK
jgi:integrase